MIVVARRATPPRGIPQPHGSVYPQVSLVWAIDRIRSAWARVEAGSVGSGCGTAVGVSTCRLLTMVARLIDVGILRGDCVDLLAGAGLAAAVPPLPVDLTHDAPLRAHTPMAMNSRPPATTPRADHLPLLVLAFKVCLAP